MLSILVCLVQVSIVAVVACCLSSLAFARAPHTAARLSWLGIFGCGLIVLASVTNLPRLLVLEANEFGASPSVTPPNHAATAPATVLNGKSASPTDATSPAGTGGSGVSLEGLVGLLGRARAKAPVLEARVTQGCLLFAGSIFVLLVSRAGFGAWSLWKMKRSSHPLVDDRVNELLTSIKGQSPKRRLQVFQCSTINAPCVSWLSRTAIYVPVNFRTWTIEEQRSGLAHELAHLIRLDAQMRFVADLLLPLFWFHPLAALLRRQLILGQELATDYHASRLVGDLEQYKKGLSMLALRTDSQRKASISFGVSVSTNNVVRRIKMLNSKRLNLVKWQRAGLTIALVAVTCGAAAWTARADEPEKVASRSKNKIAKPAGFARPATAPWKELGAQTGYLVVHPAAISSHPFYSSAYNELLAEVLEFVEIDVADTGLQIDNVLTVKTNVLASVKLIPEEERDDSDKKFNGFVTSNAGHIKFREPIDWTLLAAKLDELKQDDTSAFIALKWFVNMLNEQGESDELTIDGDEAEDEEPGEIEDLQKVFATVDGGVVTCGLMIPTDNLKEIEPELRDHDDPFAISVPLQSVQCMALGLDLDDQLHQHIKVAFLPSEGYEVEELQSHLEHCRERALTAGRAVSLIGEVAEDNPQLEAITQLVNDLAKSKFELVPANEHHDALLMFTVTLTGDIHAAMGE